jgi:hypothetical protein
MINQDFLNRLKELDDLTRNELKAIPVCAENFTDPVYLEVQRKRSALMDSLSYDLAQYAYHTVSNEERIHHKLAELCCFAAIEGRLWPLPGQ